MKAHNKSRRILLVDDDKTAIELMQELLDSEGYNVDSTTSPDEAIKKLTYSSYKALITDLKMPELSGIELLKYCNESYPGLPVIILTAHGTIESAVTALKKGAFDYLTKPVQMDELVLVLEKAISHQNMKLQNIFLMEELSKKHKDYLYYSHNENFRKILESVHTLKDVNSTVLLLGETGTGKEVLARLIHSESNKNKGRFVPINCGAIPENLIESELFGYEKGAFTDAKQSSTGKLVVADGGTLFMDEIDALPLKAQVALLRFFQEKEIIPLGSHRRIKLDVRVIAATNQDLEQLLHRGKFREDLYYRINIFPIKLPPLRERPEDIIHLASWFLAQLSRDYKKTITGFSEQAQESLAGYKWPGNIRELRNCIERAVIIEKEDKIQQESLFLASAKTLSMKFNDIGDISLQELEDAYIHWVLEKYNGNRTAAAEHLKISLRGLRYKLNK